MGRSPWAVAADLLDPPPNPWATDPAGWVATHTREDLWSDQVRILESLVEHRKTAVVACHGPGKSYTAARGVGWWIDTHDIGEAFAVSSAPTNTQVRAILWREIKRVHARGGLAGRVLDNAEWKAGPANEPVAMGRKPADYDEDAFQGIHALALLVVLDEACGIPKSLWTGALSLMTNDAARILAIGNPDHPDSEFARICEGADPDSGGMSARGWNVIPIPVFSTPAFTGERVTKEMADALVSRTWARDFAEEMGGPTLVEAHDALTELVAEGWSVTGALERLPRHLQDLIASSPVYVAKILARFPTDSTETVVKLGWVRQCQHLFLPPAPSDATQLGVDVGGSDDLDSTVIYERRGPRVGRRWTVRSSDPSVVTEKVCEAIDQASPEKVKIDSIGIGWGLMGALRRERPRVPIIGVNVAEAASEPQKYANKRAEIWWTIGRELSKDKGWDLAEVTESTVQELTTPHWKENSSGRIVVESKDDIRKRLKRSTDNADALLLAFYEGGGAPRHLGTLG